MPFLLSTSLCHVVVTWEFRKRVPSINTIEGIIARNTRSSKSQPQRVGSFSGVADHPPSTFPAGMELSNHGLPDHIVVWDTNLYSLALRRAIQLARRLWTAPDGVVPTRLVFSKTSVNYSLIDVVSFHYLILFIFEDSIKYADLHICLLLVFPYRFRLSIQIRHQILLYHLQ